MTGILSPMEWIPALKTHSDTMVKATENASAWAAEHTDAQEEAEMYTVCSHICAGFTRDPVDAQVALVVVLDELALVDAANAQLPLHCTD